MVMDTRKKIDELLKKALPPAAASPAATDPGKRPPWRPLIGPEPLDVRFSLRVSDKIFNNLKTHAQQHGLSGVSAAVRDILEKHFAKEPTQ